MAASLHGDTPYSGKTVTSVPVTPYTTSVDVNGVSSVWRGARAVLRIVAGCMEARLRDVDRFVDRATR